MHFKPSETQCKCGCGLDINLEMLTKLNEIREAFGKPISLTSGKRCQKHNDEMRPPGAKGSSHVKGVAADLVRTQELAKFLINNLEKFNLRMESLDKTPSWIHIDMSYSGVGSRIFNPSKPICEVS